MAKSRTKGHAFERQVAEEMRSLGYDKARRGLQYQDGTWCPDIVGVPWWVECKRYAARIPWQRAHNQAREDARAAGQKLMPILVVGRVDRDDPYIYMTLEDYFIAILNERNRLWGGMERIKGRLESVEAISAVEDSQALIGPLG